MFWRAPVLTPIPVRAIADEMKSVVLFFFGGDAMTKIVTGNDQAQAGRFSHQPAGDPTCLCSCLAGRFKL